jgi:hypothetical protein
MPTQAKIGYGGYVEVSSDGGSSWTRIAEARNIKPPSDNLDIIDATNMDSPGGIREYVPGLSDPGEFSFSINFVPNSGGDVKIQELRALRTTVKWRITYPGTPPATWTFDGFLQGYTPDVPTDGLMTADVSVKVTGPYVAA